MDVFGHKNQISFFEKIIKENKLKGGYILSGPEGVGKLETLKFILMKYVCKDNVPCFECLMCKRLKSLTIPDINFILPDKISENLNELYEKKEWTFENLRTDYFSRELSIGIDTIRKIENELLVRPIELKKKFYIFLDADLMGREAQNAFLKILEEPPDFVTYFLITPFPDSLHLTIRSRCIQIPFFNLSLKDFKKYFDGSKNIYFLYRISSGSIGKAKRILKENLLDEYGKFLKEMMRNEEEPYFSYREESREFLRDKIFLFGFFLREITELKLGNREIFKEHPYPSEIDYLNKRIDGYTLDLLYEKYYKILEGLKRNIPNYLITYLIDSIRFGLA
ncbi:MAG: hypothetical protein ABDH37_02335 [Candidatus Hydrothermales bacterium]